MTGFEQAKQRLENLKEEKEKVCQFQENMTKGCEQQQFFRGQEIQIEREIHFLENLLNNYYNFE